MTHRAGDRAALWAVGVTLVCLSSPSVSGQVAQGGAPPDPTAGAYRFVTHTIATGLTGGYQPVVVDLNRDRRPDVIALSTRLDELAWYENPGWQRHVLTTGLNRAINLAAHDLDDDGIPEMVVAHEFGTTHARSQGVLTLLSHPGDPTRLWDAREVDRTPTVHRVRWADIDGTGRRVLVTAPLSGAAATAPDYRDAVPIFWYRPDDWARRVVTESGQGVVHGLLAKPWEDPGRGSRRRRTDRSCVYRGRNGEFEVV